MTTFHLCYDEEGKPRIVPEGVGGFTSPTMTVEAPSWLSAKRLMGFELTPLQQRILDGTATPFELFGRTFGYADLSTMLRDPEETRGRPRKQPTLSADDVRRAWKNGWVGGLPEEERKVA